MIRVIVLSCLCVWQAFAAVQTVETRIALPPDAETYLIEHRLTGISDTAWVPVPDAATDLSVQWDGHKTVLDYRGEWDKPPAAALLPYLGGPIVALSGKGQAAVVRYRMPYQAGVALSEPMGTARIERNHATVAIAVDLPADAIAYSPSHQLSKGRALATPEESLPDAPLLLLPLSPKSGGVTMGSIAVAPRDGEDGYLLLAIAGRAEAQREAMKIAFALDISGSMQGEKLAQAKRALQDALARLLPKDTFEFISFNHAVEHHGHDGAELPLAHILTELQAGGNTNLAGAMMLPGEAGIDVDSVVVLTDGLPTTGLTDELAIRKAMAAAYGRKEVALHAIGVGSDVNALLLDAVTGALHGSVSYVQPQSDVRAAVTELLAKIGRPAARGVSLSAAGLPLSDPFPAMDAIGDIFDGDVRIMVCRYRNSGELTVRLAEQRGGVSNERLSTTLALPTATPASHDAIKRLWATRQVAAIEYRARIDNRALLPEELVQVNDIQFRYGVGSNTNLPQLQALKSGDDVVNSVDAYVDNVEKFKQRSGQSAVNKSQDYHGNYSLPVQRQSVLNDDGDAVQIKGFIQQFAGANAFRNGNRWVDGDVLAKELKQDLQSNEEPLPQKDIERGSPEWEQLLQRAAGTSKAGILGLDGELQLELDETIYNVR